ncbi:hypothetical protein [Selenihalanaerobacter shriftii]|uniref:Uncharacterized protein n=1 Tax=Selenihalanaerobacter shriftii TaxID=142842 RepID=A0A1T4LYR0_9FIRM|nr:hypothetical protein [Selenihalanaerobacter shriftii]SJZ59795.1 hypothetical protein SAMN02745118_01303 [Selenihalanaerobacter shriftii]
MLQSNHSYVETHPLEPVGPAEDLFIVGVSVFEITDFEPPLQRATVVGINLPDPGTFGPYNSYIATLEIPNDPAEELTDVPLEPTPNEDVWAGTTFLDFGGTLPPIDVSVRPQQEDGTRIGPVILQGTVFGEEVDGDNGNNEDNNNSPFRSRYRRK